MDEAFQDEKESLEQGMAEVVVQQVGQTLVGEEYGQRSMSVELGGEREKWGLPVVWRETIYKNWEYVLHIWKILS